MKYFMEYVKSSYELIMQAEAKANIFLDEESECWTVHTFAKYITSPHIPTDAIAIKMLTAVNETGEIRKQHFQTIAEECALIHGLELNSRRWPSKNYYRDMGRLALEHRAYSERPPEIMYERIAHRFNDISQILHFLKA